MTVAVMKHARHDVFAAARAALRDGDAATLAVVLETEGSTYVAAGAVALFGTAAGQVGWLSGGCLEPEIARVAQDAARSGRVAWMEVDTRDDEDLLAGSALGCRGRLRLALLPLAALPGADAPLRAWCDGRVAMSLEMQADGLVSLAAGAGATAWRLPADAPGWEGGASRWQLRIAPPPELVVFGAGPEAPTLLPLLRDLGWKTTLVERRPRWLGLARHADRHVAAAPADGLRSAPAFDAALVMHHNFELDLEALQALAGDATPFVGLLGPARRREDLFRVLGAARREALLPRLRSPVGLKLGGQGAEAIALSIAAQLQAWRHGEERP